MRGRWHWLFGCSIVSLAGLTWLLTAHAAAFDALAAASLLGLIGSAGLGVGGAITETPRKWPAAAALAGTLPSTQRAVLAFPTTVELMLHDGGAGHVLHVTGAIGATVTAVAILVLRPPPPPTDDVVVRARVVR